MLGNMFLWRVANLKKGVIYFIKQACGNDIMASVYMYFFLNYRPYKEVTCLEEDLKKAILLNNENMEREWMKGVK